MSDVGAAIGLYIHIPFCTRKCPYCDFYSVPFDEDLADKYCDAICKGGILPPAVAFDTVYLGGGTPSLLGAKRILRMLSIVNITDDAEITIEVNPASCTGLEQLHNGGINRISVGVQSLDDRELKSLGRLHTAEEARSCIIDAHKAGFKRISADLMLGIENQTLSSLKASVEGLAKLPLDHISAYILTPHADEEKAASLYLAAVELLAANGFEQYEISNFARSGSVSRHNLKYWRCEPYIGVGPSAHSFYGGRRSHFPNDTEAFINSENPLTLSVPDGPGGSFEEYAMLRLRLTEGLKSPEEMLARAVGIAALSTPPLVQVDGDTIRLTPRGFLLSNAIIAELLVNRN